MAVKLKGSKCPSGLFVYEFCGSSSERIVNFTYLNPFRLSIVQKYSDSIGLFQGSIIGALFIVDQLFYLSSTDYCGSYPFTCHLLYYHNIKDFMSLLY